MKIIFIFVLTILLLISFFPNAWTKQRKDRSYSVYDNYGERKGHIKENPYGGYDVYDRDWNRKEHIKPNQDGYEMFDKNWNRKNNGRGEK